MRVVMETTLIIPITVNIFPQCVLPHVLNPLTSHIDVSRAFIII